MAKNIKSILRSERGAALIIVLALVIVISIGVTAILINNVYSTENSLTSEKQIRALEAARGGVEHALYELDDRLAALGEGQQLQGFTITRADELYEVVVTVTADQFSVESKAPYDTMLGTKYMRYVLNGELGEQTSDDGEMDFDLGHFSSDLFNYAIATKEDRWSNTLTITNRVNIEVEGSVAATNVSISPNFTDYNQVDPLTASTFDSNYNGLVSQLSVYSPQVTIPIPSGLSGTTTYPNSNTQGNSDTLPGSSKFRNLTIKSGQAGYIATVQGDLSVRNLNMEGASATLHVMGDLYLRILNMKEDSQLTLIVDGNIYCEQNFSITDTNNSIIAKKNIYIGNMLSINNGNNTEIIAGGNTIKGDIYCGRNISITGNNNKLSAGDNTSEGNIYSEHMISLTGNNNEMFATNHIRALHSLTITGYNVKINAGGILSTGVTTINYNGNNPNDYMEIYARHMINETAQYTPFNVNNNSSSTSPILRLNVQGIFLTRGVSISSSPHFLTEIDIGYISVLNNFVIRSNGASAGYLNVGGVSASKITIDNISNLTFGSSSGGVGGDGEVPGGWQGKSFEIISWEIKR